MRRVAAAFDVVQPGREVLVERLDVVETQLYRKRHEIEPWLARAGCAGAAAAEVRAAFRAAPAAIRETYLIDDESFTDTKMCLRAVRRHFS